MSKFTVEELMNMSDKELNKAYEEKQKEVAQYHQAQWQKISNILYMQNVMQGDK